MAKLERKMQQYSLVLTSNRKKGWDLFWTRFKKNWQLHVMMILPVVWIIMFHYIPIYGIQIAFREYSNYYGMWGSEYVGFLKLAKFFGNYKWSSYVVNTLSISLYSLVAGFPTPIILALIIHVNDRKILKKITQNVSYIPHFISTVVMVGILIRIFDQYTGLLASFNRLLGITDRPNLMANVDAFRHIYVWSGIWQGMGWSTILYIASLSAVSEELHEAARIDGANRLKRVWHVDIPAILPVISIQLILRFGHIMSVGYEKVYLIHNSVNLPVSEIISIHVCKRGIQDGDLSYGAAVGLMNTFINTTLVVLVNWITTKLTDGEGGLF